MRVRWPPPFDFSQSRTCGSRRTLTATFRLTSRMRTILTSCWSVKRRMSRKLMSESSPDAWRRAARRRACRSLSLNCLLLISSDLTLLRPAGRDNPDDFFTMRVLPVCVHNNQHGGGPRLDANTPDRVPVLFPRLVYAVRTDQAAFVFEDQRRQLE